MSLIYFWDAYVLITVLTIYQNVGHQPLIVLPQVHLWAKIVETFTFFCVFIKKPLSIGAIIPSSTSLSLTITKYIDKNKSGKYILEVGAGTGSFTQFILAQLNPGDTLDIVENDPLFYSILQEKFGHFPNVNVYSDSILAWKPQHTYDYIVSGLPINVFDAESLQKIFDIYAGSLKATGVYAYSEYLFVPTLKASWYYLVDYHKYLTYLEARQTNRDFRSSFTFYTEEIVWNNMFPSRVLTCWQSDEEHVLV